MFSDAYAPGTGFHPITTVDKGDHHERQSTMAMLLMVIFIVFIIFAIIIFFAFFARKDERRGIDGEANMLAPLTAIAAMNAARPIDNGYAACNRGYEHDNFRMEWDHSRDDLKGMGELKEEIKENGWKLSAENAKYFYETSKEIDRNRYDHLRELDFVKAEVAASERRILEKIDSDKYDRVRDERDAARLEANSLKYHTRPLAFPGYGVPDPAFQYAG